MSKTIHILGAGGAAGIGMTRCLKDYYDVLGLDDSTWARLIMECDDGTGKMTDMVIPVPDELVYERARITTQENYLFLPHISHITLCRHKDRTASVLGDLSPLTYWVRDTTGAGGKGAQMASEYLPGKNCSVELVYYKGVLKASFQKERLSYLVAKKEPDVTKSGSSMVSICIQDSELMSRSMEAIEKISAYTESIAHGFYGIDFKYDENGVPKVTEINAGRLLTASYVYYYMTGYNLPLVGVRAHFGESTPQLPDYPVGYGIIRQVDKEPQVFPPEVTKSWL